MMRIFALCVFVLLGTVFGMTPDLAMLNDRFERLLEVLYGNHIRGICYGNGEFRLSGETWTAEDGCNDCYCSSNGYVACTLRYCQPEDRCPGGGMLWWQPKCFIDETCPVGYRCHKPEGVCCPNAGCPRLNPYIRVVCIWPLPKCDPNTCNKCCPAYCGTTCHTDPPADPMNLKCPTPTSNLVGSCDEKCTSDEDCKVDGELCCSNGCGIECMPAEKKYHPNCPAVNETVVCVTTDKCGVCEPPKQCCPSDCGERCKDVPLA